jgi:hypothetical protein
MTRTDSNRNASGIAVGNMAVKRMESTDVKRNPTRIVNRIMISTTIRRTMKVVNESGREVKGMTSYKDQIEPTSAAAPTNARTREGTGTMMTKTTTKRALRELS